MQRHFTKVKIMKIKNSYFLIFVFIISCGSLDKDWQTARHYDTIDSYKEFISQHPNKTLQDSAEYYLDEEYLLEAIVRNSVSHYKNILKENPDTKFGQEYKKEMDILISQRLESFRNVKTINIILDDSYGERTASSYPFKEIMTILFENVAGLIISFNSNEHADAVLKIISRYEPRGENYYGNIKEIKGTQYTGANLYGKIELSVSGNILIQKNFYGSKAPLNKISIAYPPNNAPFWEVFHSEVSFLPTLLSMCQETFGCYFMIGLITSTNIDELGKKYSLLPQKFRDLIVFECLNNQCTIQKDRLIQISDISEKYDRFQKAQIDKKQTNLMSHSKPQYGYANMLANKLLSKYN